jgi:hypothetical protein
MHAGTRTKGAIVTAYILYIYIIYTQKHNVLPRSCRRRWTVKKYCSSHSLTTTTLKYLISSHLHLIDKTQESSSSSSSSTVLPFHLERIERIRSKDYAMRTLYDAHHCNGQYTANNNNTAHNHNSLHTRARACVYICGACACVYARTLTHTDIYIYVCNKPTTARMRFLSIYLSIDR